MLTIDQTIIALEDGIRSIALGEGVKLSVRDEVIRYLKEYQTLRNTFDQPLIIDELKQMVGMPVWIEWTEQSDDDDYLWKHQEWFLVNYYYHDDKFGFEQLWVADSDGEIRQFTIGDKTWKAYRKERK